MPIQPRFADLAGEVAVEAHPGIGADAGRPVAAGFGQEGAQFGAERGRFGRRVAQVEAQAGHGGASSGLCP
jgi:hypothetical protein